MLEFFLEFFNLFIKREIGKTIAPKAAKWNFASANRAMEALTNDISAPLSSQLAARGHQAVKTCRVVSGACRAESMSPGLYSSRAADDLWIPRF